MMLNIPEELKAHTEAIQRLQPINDGVLFQFLDSTGGTKRMFTDRATASGIIISAQRADQQMPRWGQVLAVGPDVDISVGEYILIEGGRWSPDTTIMGTQLWKTDGQQILAVSMDINDTI